MSVNSDENPEKQSGEWKNFWLMLGAGLVLVALLLVRIGFRQKGSNDDQKQTVQTSTSNSVQRSNRPEQIAITNRAISTNHVALTFRDTNSPTGKLIVQLLSSSLPLKTRRQAARALAKLGSDEAIAALKLALQNGPASLKGAIGEALGESPHREARAIMMDLINGRDDTAARGAIRGLALRGDSEASDVLGNILFNPQKSSAVRTEAALSLGEVAQSGALNALCRAAWEIKNDEILEQVLQGLGKRPVEETASFFRNYLEASNVSAQSKVAALEALGNSTGDISTLALRYVSDPNPELRAAAAWALSATESHENIGPQLLDLLKQETNPEVRMRLYEALGAQEKIDQTAVLGLAQTETDSSVRQAGFGLLADACRAEPTPEVVTFFDSTAVPELKAAALADKDRQNRLSAVIILRRARTEASAQALEEIARESDDHKIVETAQAALRK